MLTFMFWVTYKIRIALLLVVNFNICLSKCINFIKNQIKCAICTAYCITVILKMTLMAEKYFIYLGLQQFAHYHRCEKLFLLKN